MTGLFYLGVFLAVWGILTMIIGLTKPEKFWRTGKIQGFVKLIGARGTQLMLLIIGIIATAGGLWLFIVGING